MGIVSKDPCIAAKPYRLIHHPFEKNNLFHPSPYELDREGSGLKQLMECLPFVDGGSVNPVEPMLGSITYGNGEQLHANDILAGLIDSDSVTYINKRIKMRDWVCILAATELICETIAPQPSFESASGVSYIIIIGRGGGELSDHSWSSIFLFIHSIILLISANSLFAFSAISLSVLSLFLY